MKISIITVVFNNHSFILNCIDSVRHQTYPNIEHIVIDGCSTDGTLEKLKSRVKDLSILISEPDSGIYDAMNKGLKLATGEIIGFLNSDDFYYHDKVLEIVANTFENDSTLDACYSNLVYVNKFNTLNVSRYWLSSEYFPNAFSRGWSPPHPTFFLRRSVYHRFGTFNLNYKIAADIELMMRFLEVYRVKSKYISDIWVKMRLGGTTNKSAKNICIQNFEVLKALKSHDLDNNLIIFVFYKFCSRFKQFFRKPT